MMSCDENHLYIGDDNLIELHGLYSTDTLGQPPITDAVVSVIGVDTNSVAIGGVTWPITLIYDSGGDRYYGNLPTSAELVENGRYTFTFTVTAEDKVSTFRTFMYAEYRRGF